MYPWSGSWESLKYPQTVIYLALVSREWKNGSNSSYNCTPFLHSLLTKGKYSSLLPSKACSNDISCYSAPILLHFANQRCPYQTVSYIYIYMYVCMHVYIYIYVYVYVYTYIHIYIYIYVYVYLYIYIYIRTFKLRQSCKQQEQYGPEAASIHKSSVNLDRLSGRLSKTN